MSCNFQLVMHRELILNLSPFYKEKAKHDIKNLMNFEKKDHSNIKHDKVEF